MSGRVVSAEERSRVLRLYDPRDSRSISLIARRMGFSRDAVRNILFGEVVKADPAAAAARSKRCVEKAQAQRAEREAHWGDCKSEAERLLRAGRDVVSVSVELGVSLMRVKSLRKDLESGSKSCA